MPEKSEAPVPEELAVSGVECTAAGAMKLSDLLLGELRWEGIAVAGSAKAER
jgi:hypothetical protein